MKECNIVKDLLPLYVEELCSEDTREYVEKHLESCIECKESFQYLKYSEVCVETVESKEINVFRKLERYISGKILVSYFLFLATLAVGTMILLGTVVETPMSLYYVLLPVVIIATVATFRNVIHTEVDGQMRSWRIVLQVILLAGSSLIMFCAFLSIREGRQPFGTEVYKLGPVLNGILRVGIIASLVLLVTHLYQVGRKKERYSIWSNLSILCIFLNLVYDGILFWLSDFDTIFYVLVKNTLIMYGIFGVVILGMYLYNGIKSK